MKTHFANEGRQDITSEYITNRSIELHRMLIWIDERESSRMNVSIRGTKSVQAWQGTLWSDLKLQRQFKSWQVEEHTISKIQIDNRSQVCISDCVHNRSNWYYGIQIKIK